LQKCSVETHGDEPLKTPTKLGHLGRHASQYSGFVNPPVYRGSTMLFSSLTQLQNPPLGYGYGRKGSPAQTALGDLMLDLEQGAYCKLTSCGLMAITGTLLGLLKAGDHILVSDSVFYPTRHFCDLTLKAMGIETTYYNPLIGGGISELLRPETTLIYTESPGSDSFEIQDIPAIVKVARSKNLFVVMDNTWATPLFFRPLEHGVDVSIHSATKYITGHSDALLGIVIANERVAKKLEIAQGALGLCPGAEEVFSALKGLRTLDIRMKKHQENAVTLASWLEERDEVAQVLHPALPSFAGHNLWKRDFNGSSGLFSIILKSCSTEALAAMVDHLKLFGIGWSWGGYESLIVLLNAKGARTATNWQPEGPFLRIHAGLEDIEDLKEDLKQGFKRLRHP
jgi:cystathionine beta-lyase